MKVKIVTGILAYIATFGLDRMILRTEDLFTLPNSIFSIFIFAAIWKFFLSVSKLINRRALICALILGGIFSSFMVFGTNLFSNDTTEIDKLKTWGTILAGTPFFSAVIIWIFNFIDNFKKNSISAESITAKKYFLISWAIIFAAWIPALLAQFPGIFAYDSPTQVNWYEENKIFSAHPPVHTALLGFCVLTLGKIFGSSEFGFLIYTLIQMLAVSAIFAAVLTYMLQKNISKNIRIGWTLFFMFFPLNLIMAMSATKDILFSVFLAAMILIFFISLEKTPKFFYPLAIIFAFMCMIFRNQGIYIFAFGMIFGLLIMQGQRVRMLKIFAAGILLYVIYMNIVFGVLGGQNDKAFVLREMLGVPVVQITRVAAYKQNELSAAEIEQVKKYIPDYEIYHVPGARGSSDPPRRRFNYLAVYEDYHEFWNMYKKYARKYPLEYFDAFCRTSCAQWYPDIFFYKYYDGQPYFQYESFKTNEEGYTMIRLGLNNVITSTAKSEADAFIPKNHSVFGFQWINDLYFHLAYKFSYEKIPVISMLFSTGFTFWLILIFTFYFLYKKNYGALFPASFIIGLWLTMIFGPLALYRYTFPLMMSIPILFAYTFGNNLNEGK